MDKPEYFTNDEWAAFTRSDTYRELNEREEDIERFSRGLPPKPRSALQYVAAIIGGTGGAIAGFVVHILPRLLVPAAIIVLMVLAWFASAKAGDDTELWLKPYTHEQTQALSKVAISITAIKFCPELVLDAAGENAYLHGVGFTREDISGSKVTAELAMGVTNVEQDEKMQEKPGFCAFARVSLGPAGLGLLKVKAASPVPPAKPPLSSLSDPQ